VSTSPAGSDILDTPDAGGLVIRGGVFRFASYVAVVALSIIPVAVLTRYLGVTRFGQYATVISLVTVASVVTDVGMSALGTREYAVREGADRDRLMRDLLGLRVALTLLGVVFATAFAALAGYDAALLAGTVAAALSTVALVFQHTLCIPLSAELRIGLMSLLDLVRQALTVVAIIALVLLGAGLFPLLSVTLVVYALLIPITARYARGRISLHVAIHPDRWVQLLRLTVYFSLASAVGALYAYTAQITTSLVATPQENGLFAASFRVYVVATTVPGLLVSGALPLIARAARDDRTRLAYAMQRIFEVSLILGVAAGVGLLAGGQFIINVVAGQHYDGAVVPLHIEGIALMLSFLVAGWGFALLSLEEYAALLAVNAAAFLVSCGLTIGLAPSHGADGAAVAVLCGEATLLGGYVVAIARRSPELRPRLNVMPKVVLAAVPAVALAVLPALPSVARLALALVVYGLVIVLTRAVPAEVVEIIPRPRRASRTSGV